MKTQKFKILSLRMALLTILLSVAYQCKTYMHSLRLQKIYL